jgi:hypothetical protein
MPPGETLPMNRNKTIAIISVAVAISVMVVLVPVGRRPRGGDPLRDEDTLGELKCAIVCFNRDAGNYPVANAGTGGVDLAVALTEPHYSGSRTIGPYMPDDSASPKPRIVGVPSDRVFATKAFLDKYGHPFFYYTRSTTSTSWGGVPFDSTQNPVDLKLDRRSDWGQWKKTLADASFLLVGAGSKQGWGGSSGPDDRLIISGP